MAGCENIGGRRRPRYLDARRLDRGNDPIVPLPFVGLLCDIVGDYLLTVCAPGVGMVDVGRPWPNWGTVDPPYEIGQPIICCPLVHEQRLHPSFTFLPIVRFFDCSPGCRCGPDNFLGVDVADFGWAGILDGARLTSNGLVFNDTIDFGWGGILDGARFTNGLSATDAFVDFGWGGILDGAELTSVAVCSYGYATFADDLSDIDDYVPDIDPSNPLTWRQWGSSGSSMTEWVGLGTPWVVSGSDALPGLVADPAGLGVLWTSHRWASSASDNVRIWIGFSNMAPGDVVGIVYRVTSSGDAPSNITNFGEIQFGHNGAGAYDVNVYGQTTGPAYQDTITSMPAGAGLTDTVIRLEIVDNYFKAFWGGDLFNDSSMPSLSWYDADTPKTFEHGMTGNWGSGSVGVRLIDWYCVEPIDTPLGEEGDRPA